MGFGAGGEGRIGKEIDRNTSNCVIMYLMLVESLYPVSPN